MHDLIIIGGGPAALSAGIYAGRKQINTLLLTKDWGGQMQWTNRIENYPGFSKVSGQDLIEKMVDHFKENTGDFVKIQKEVEVKEITKEEKIFNISLDDNLYQSKSVLVATGRRPKKLGVKGEDEFANKGVSYCPICDGPVFKDKEVAVIGGGNAALESALDLLSYCPKVYILEFMDKLTADEVLINEVKNNSKIEILTNVEVKEIRGENFVGGLVYEDRDNKKTQEVKVEGVFISIGSVANSDFIKNMLELNENGEIKVGKNNKTSQDGVFASGDCTNIRYKQIIIAAGEGAKAALEASRYLSGL